MTDQDRLQSFSERYESGEIPWDDQLPPPELIDLADQLRPGRALDLGSGYGRTSIFLGLRGWQVDGVEFVERAVEESRRRAQKAGVSDLVQFHVADVSELDSLQGPYELAVDIGCMHTLQSPELEAYCDGLSRLLASGAHYLLFAHLRDPLDESEDGRRWIEEDALRQLLARDLSLAHVEHGITQVSDKPPWPSAWFYYRRL
jgi:cyclopropane fatty-acyl-phospholipid synthase-like methyltransferase